MSISIHKSTAQQIVDTVKDVCGHDINFIDANGMIFASTNVSRIGDYHEIGKQVYTTQTPIEVEQDDQFYGTHKGVNIPLVYNGQMMGVIGISGVPDEVRKYVYLAQKITLLLLREHEFDAQTQNKKNKLNYIIHALVTNDPISHDYLNDFLESNGITLESIYQTLLISLDARYNPSNIFMIERKIFEAFEKAMQHLYTFNYPNEYILFIEKEQLKGTLYIFRELAHKYRDILKIGIGIGASLTRQHHSYDSAKIAIKSLNGEDNIALFENLDIEILLGSISKEVIHHFLSKTIDTLDEKDRTLLTTYFRCDMSLKDTCQKLYLHKNTLQYKLDRIWHLCGYNPRSFKDAAVLYLALKLKTFME